MTKLFIDPDDDILKDGETRTFKMYAKDGSPNRDLTPLQLEIARASRQRDAQPTRMTVVDALGRSDQLHLRQPGARYAVYDAGSNEHAMQQTLRAMRDEAYASASEDASNAWKKGGDREIGMSLDNASITDARERALADYDTYVSNAWRAGR